MFRHRDGFFGVVRLDSDYTPLCLVPFASESLSITYLLFSTYLLPYPSPPRGLFSSCTYLLLAFVTYPRPLQKTQSPSHLAPIYQRALDLVFGLFICMCYCAMELWVECLCYENSRISFVVIFVGWMDGLMDENSRNGLMGFGLSILVLAFF